MPGSHTLHLLTMRFCPILILFGLASTPAYAQFDYGLAFGGVRTQMRAIQRDAPHASAWVSDATHSVFSASMFYRERYSNYVDLGFDAVLTHQSFSAGYSYSGRGGGTSKSAHAELDLLYLGIKPEVRMDAKRLAVVRFGLMAGIRMGGSARGIAQTWSAMGHYTRLEDADLTGDFGGDLRFAFGFGFRVPAGERWAITIDPEATIGLTSMVYDHANIRGTDIGLRIGLSRRCGGKALTTLFKAKPVDAATGPAW